MRRKTLQFALCVVPSILLVLAFFSGIPKAGASPGLTGYSTEISVEPSKKAEGAFLCKALVKNLASGAVEAAPAVLTAAGEQAEAETSLADGASKIRFLVKVDAGASLASYSVVVSHSGADTLLHRGTVQLAKGQRDV